MPKQSPIPTDLDRPFYDAYNDELLVVQHCAPCNRCQFPPRLMCPRCGWTNLERCQVSGPGRIQSRVVVSDTPVSTLIADQPFNVATIALEEEPEANDGNTTTAAVGMNDG